MARERLCFDLPGDMHFPGDPEKLGQIWSTIGYTTQVAAWMDWSIGYLLAKLTRHPTAPVLVPNTADAIRKAKRLLQEDSYGTDDFRSFVESSLEKFAAFQDRRSRFVHDRFLTAPTAAVRIQSFEGRVQHSSESLEGLIEHANRIWLLAAELNDRLDDLTRGGISETPGSSPA
jgi:hypothetical protein